MDIHKLLCVKLNRPEWFDRSDWLEFLNGVGDRPPATWHKQGLPATEFSDVFTVFDAGDRYQMD